MKYNCVVLLQNLMAIAIKNVNYDHCYLDDLLKSTFRNVKIFINGFGNAYKFSIYPATNPDGMARIEKIRQLIKKNGGEVTISTIGVGLYTIQLVDRQTQLAPFHSKFDVFDVSYIFDSIKEQCPLDLKDYRIGESKFTDDVDPMKIALQIQSWKDAIRKSMGSYNSEDDADIGNQSRHNQLRTEDKNSDQDISWPTDEDDGFVSRPGGLRKDRRPYSHPDDLKLIKHLLVKRYYILPLSGNNVWKRIEKEKVLPERTYHSLRERFLKSIIPRINSFKLKEKDKRKLVDGRNFRRRLNESDSEWSDSSTSSTDDDLAIVAESKKRGKEPLKFVLDDKDQDEPVRGVVDISSQFEAISSAFNSAPGPSRIENPPVQNSETLPSTSKKLDCNLNLSSESLDISNEVNSTPGPSRIENLPVKNSETCQTLNSMSKKLVCQLMKKGNCCLNILYRSDLNRGQIVNETGQRPLSIPGSPKMKNYLASKRKSKNLRELLDGEKVEEILKELPPTEDDFNFKNKSLLMNPQLMDGNNSENNSKYNSLNLNMDSNDTVDLVTRSSNLERTPLGSIDNLGGKSITLRASTPKNLSFKISKITSLKSYSNKKDQHTSKQILNMTESSRILKENKAFENLVGSTSMPLMSAGSPQLEQLNQSPYLNDHSSSDNLATVVSDRDSLLIDKSKAILKNNDKNIYLIVDKEVLRKNDLVKESFLSTFRLCRQHEVRDFQVSSSQRETRSSLNEKLNRHSLVPKLINVTENVKHNNEVSDMEEDNSQPENRFSSGKDGSSSNSDMSVSSQSPQLSNSNTQSQNIHLSNSIFGDSTLNSDSFCIIHVQGDDCSAGRGDKFEGNLIESQIEEDFSISRQSLGIQPHNIDENNMESEELENQTDSRIENDLNISRQSLAIQPNDIANEELSNSREIVKGVENQNTNSQPNLRDSVSIEHYVTCPESSSEADHNDSNNEYKSLDDCIDVLNRTELSNLTCDGLCNLNISLCQQIFSSMIGESGNIEAKNIGGSFTNANSENGNIEGSFTTINGENDEGSNLTLCPDSDEETPSFLDCVTDVASNSNFKMPKIVQPLCILKKLTDKEISNATNIPLSPIISPHIPLRFVPSYTANDDSSDDECESEDLEDETLSQISHGREKDSNKTYIVRGTEFRNKSNMPVISSCESLDVLDNESFTDPMGNFDNFTKKYDRNYSTKGSGSGLNKNITQRCSKSYTVDEDIEILKHIFKRNLFDEVKGRKMWRDLELMETIQGRTWQGLKERFIRRIFPNIDKYENKGVSLRVINQFKTRLGNPSDASKTNVDKGSRNRSPTKKKSSIKKRTKASSSASELDTKPRSNYDIKEDRAILRFITENRRFNKVRGKSLWVSMSKQKDLTNRSWESLKERFRRIIIFNLDRYDLSKENLNRLKRIRDKCPVPERFKYKKTRKRRMNLEFIDDDSSNSDNDEVECRVKSQKKDILPSKTKSKKTFVENGSSSSSSESDEVRFTRKRFHFINEKYLGDKVASSSNLVAGSSLNISSSNKSRKFKLLATDAEIFNQSPLTLVNNSPKDGPRVPLRSQNKDILIPGAEERKCTPRKFNNGSKSQIEDGKQNKNNPHNHESDSSNYDSADTEIYSPPSVIDNSQNDQIAFASGDTTLRSITPSKSRNRKIGIVTPLKRTNESSASDCTSSGSETHSRTATPLESRENRRDSGKNIDKPDSSSRKTRTLDEKKYALRRKLRLKKINASYKQAKLKYNVM